MAIAAAKLCKAELACLAKFSAKPEKDPTLAALDACRDKAQAKFVSSYQKAIATAAKKGRFCAADDPAAADGIADAAISTPATDLAEDVLGVDLASWASADKIDKALRGGLLKAAAKYCGKDLAILGGTAKKPNREKPAAARVSARAKFDASAAKITAKAAGKGVVYPGRPPAELGDEIEQLADDFADAPSQP